VLLAYEMNGAHLRPEHGFPLRVVVPGYVGARSVKWLSRVQLREAPSDNRFQAREYRLFPPYLEEPEDPSLEFALGELPVNAVICAPEDGETLRAGPVSVRGCTIAGGERRVERVDLSADEGETWSQAGLAEEDYRPGAWRLWQAKLELPPGRHRIVVRAVDSAADTQPEDPRSVWNPKAYVNNAWHAVVVNVL
jgi:sulfite oxidase